MSDVLLLYLFTRVDVLLAVCALVMVIGVFGVVVACLIRYDDQEWPWFFRPVLIALCVAGTTLVVVPDQKSLAIMIGGKVVVDAVRSPDTQEIGGLLVERINDVLREHK